MFFNLALIAASGALFTLVVLRVVAPRAYRKYIVRDSPTYVSRSSNAAALIILAAMVVVGIHFGLHFFRAATQSNIHAPLGQYDREARIQAWVGLLCAAVTGAILCLFPDTIVTNLLRTRVGLADADEEGKKKIKTIGRIFGLVFLIGAVLIARQLV